MKKEGNIKFNTDFLLRYLEGKLSEAEICAFEAEMQRSRSLKDELEGLAATQMLLRQTADAASEDALSPFFTDRLMKELAPAPVGLNGEAVEDELANLLSRLFRPVALAGFFLALCLAVYNINLSNGYSADPSTTESILAMPPVTSIAVYDLDLYSAEYESLP